MIQQAPYMASLPFPTPELMGRVNANSKNPDKKFRHEL